MLNGGRAHLLDAPHLTIVSRPRDRAARARVQLRRRRPAGSASDPKSAPIDTSVNGERRTSERYRSQPLDASAFDRIAVPCAPATARLMRSRYLALSRCASSCEQRRVSGILLRAPRAIVAARQPLVAGAGSAASGQRRPARRTSVPATARRRVRSHVDAVGASSSCSDKRRNARRARRRRPRSSPTRRVVARSAPGAPRPMCPALGRPSRRTANAAGSSG